MDRSMEVDATMYTSYPDTQEACRSDPNTDSEDAHVPGKLFSPSRRPLLMHGLGTLQQRHPLYSATAFAKFKLKSIYGNQTEIRGSI